MKIIALGDSFTEGFLVNDKSYTRFLEKAGFDVVNLGKNGSTTEEMEKRYKSYLKTNAQAHVLIIFGGTNDLIMGLGVEMVIDNLKSILSISTARKTLLISPPFIEEDPAYPVYGSINTKIARLKEKAKGLRADMFIGADTIGGHYLDGVHMAKDFHKNLAGEIIQKLGGEIDRKSK